MKDLYRWITTPPQAYAVYAILVLVIGGLSFMAGTLKPKTSPGAPPPIAAQQR